VAKHTSIFELLARYSTLKSIPVTSKSPKETLRVLSFIVLAVAALALIEMVGDIEVSKKIRKLLNSFSGGD
jgi:hypothetical protein